MPTTRTSHRLLLLTIGIIAGFVALELAVRARHFVKFGTTVRKLHRFARDPATGLRLPAPGRINAAIRVNSRHFRGPEIEVPKPADRLRLAFLGGSTTFCAEASSEETTWPHLVWQRLQERFPARRFDYVNAGVAGYDADDSRRHLELHVTPLQPDAIVIYHATNDLTTDTRALARAQGLLNRRPTDGSALAEWSHLWFLLEKNWQVHQRSRQAVAATAHLRFAPRDLARGFAIRLRRLIDASQQLAPVVAVATFSHKARRQQPPEIQLAASNTSLYFMPYMTVDGLLSAFEEYNHAIRDVARATGALLIDREDLIPGTDEFFADSVHFTDRGNARMSDRVVTALVDAPPFQALMRAEPQ